MDAFLPSEIGRLIYGYLFQQCGEGLADEFLNSCDSMRECRLLKQKYAKNFHHRVQDLSLEDILNQYSVLCSLIFKQATGEEPVHRNVLGLLKKVLGSRLLGRSGSSADGSRAKPTSNGSSLSDKTEASAVVSVAQSKQPARADKVGNSADDRRAAIETAPSVAQFEQPASPIEDSVAFSPDVAGDNCRMDVDDFGCGDTLEESPLNVAEESAPVVSTECPQKIISPNAESRICAILCNSASMETRVRQQAGMSNLPFPTEYCTPRKQQPKSTFSVPALSSADSTTVSVATTVVKTKVMKSIENVSKNLASAAESSLAVSKSGEQSSRKLADKGAKKEKVLQRDTQRTPAKSVATKSTVESASVIFPAAKANDQLGVIAASTSAVEVSPATVSPSRVPTSAVAFVHQEPRVSPIAVANVQRVPAPTSAGAIAQESTESVFGELSFESECSLSGALHRSDSSVKSDGEAVSKLSRSSIELSPGNADASVDSVTLTRCRVTVTPTRSSATETLETSLQTPTTTVSDAVLLPSSTETASTGFQKRDTLAWDQNLRSFVDSAAPMDAHITKRKPKDLRSRKLREACKKRKHTDDVDDPSSTAKRFKSETVAAVPVGVVTPRQPPICKSVDVDQTVRRRRAAKDVLESTVGLEKKSNRNGRSKSGPKSQITFESANRVGVGEESARTAEAASSARSSMNDIFDFGGGGEKKSERLEKATAERKRQGTNVKKANREEIQEATKTRSSAVALGDKNAVGTTGTRGRKKSEQIEDRKAAKKKSKDVDPKIAPLKSSLPQVKAKPTSSPGKTNDGRRKDGLSRGTDDVDKETDEILDHNGLNVTTVESTINSPIQDEESDFEMVLETSPEFELFYRSPRYEDS